MHRFISLSVFFIAATFGAQVAGCASVISGVKPPESIGSSSSAQVSQQLILKFKPASIACTEQAIANFSKSIGVRLNWLRPMSGDACVVIQTAATAGELAKDHKRLEKHSYVEWVEVDAVMQRH